MSEEWRPVAGFPGYEVSNWGRVRSPRRRSPKDMKQQLNHAGYPTVTLYRDGHRVVRFVHRLVAEAFLGPRPDGYQVDHIDAVRTNAHASNLRYLTPRQNKQAASTGRCGSGRHEMDEGNTYKNERTGSSACRACRREWQRDSRRGSRERAAIQAA